jgi:hypothetical protein
VGLGNAAAGIARLVGALLVVYAAALLWNARRVTVARGEVVMAVRAARDRPPPPAQRGLTVLHTRRRSRTIGRHEARQRGPPRRAV